MLLNFILCLFMLPLAMPSSPPALATNISKPGCPTHCGNVIVPYPFGIGEDTNCSLNDSLFVTCNTSYEPPKLFLRSGNIEIHNISDSELQVHTPVYYKCYNEEGGVSVFSESSFILHRFTFSVKNKFTVVGCDDYALINGTGGAEFASGCFGLCSKEEDAPDGQCSGMGCCQTSMPTGLKVFNVTLHSFQNHTHVWPFNSCGYAFLAEEGSFEFGGIRDLYNGTMFYDKISSTVPVVLDWVIEPTAICPPIANEHVCKGNSSCYDVKGGGYRCKCNNGYEGNPYLGPGCQDIDECKGSLKNTCYGDCINTLGSYTCTCPSGSFGNATEHNGCQSNAKESKFSGIIFTIVMASAVLAILSGIMAIYFSTRRRKLMRLREKFFEKNGGLLLKERINSPGSNEVMTLFTPEQLRKATNNYSHEQIIGRGAYGVVYKGVLSDKREVAIKKSKLVDETQAEQFINEVMILTKVIHRNVVKLLGCCLEEEVPVLVYEFISNNALFHHIHHRLGGMNWLSWENRLRIAAEAAAALGYLHSETTMPIIHRDVKSSNILLDDNYTTKISDFGGSREVPLDHNQVTTLIQGTLGYLDPEYFHTSKLTDKSDVYSFGVVLAELMTGKKPIGVDRTNEAKNLATYFVMSIKENRLFEIVEPRLLREGTIDQLQAVADLAKRCLDFQGHNRPTMKEVAAELEGLRRFTVHPRVERSSVLEVEESDLYQVPLVSSVFNGSESYSDLAFEEYKPR